MLVNYSLVVKNGSYELMSLQLLVRYVGSRRLAIVRSHYREARASRLYGWNAMNVHSRPRIESPRYERLSI